VTGIGIIYYYAPDALQEWVWITPGAVFATVLWILISLGFKLYLANWGNYNETYGALAGVIILLLWFYLSGLAILVGAELNAEIEHASPYGKAPGEKAPGGKGALGEEGLREYASRIEAGQAAPAAFDAASGRAKPNCDLDVPPHGRRPLKPSQLLITAVALLPPVLALGRRARRRLGV
jgi:hypothetical protein